MAESMYDKLIGPGRPNKSQAPEAYSTLGALSPAPPTTNSGAPGRPGNAPAGPIASPLTTPPLQPQQPGQQPGAQPSTLVVMPGQQPQPAPGAAATQPQQAQGAAGLPVQPVAPPPQEEEKPAEPVYNPKTGELETPLTEKQRQEYARQEAAAKAKYGSTPWSNDPGAPKPKIVVGKPNFNPFANPGEQWS